VKLDDKFDDAAAHRYNLDRRKGARVVEVYANTPASTAGIKVNDLILDFNGMAIEDENHLIHLVSLTELNRPVRVIVLREGQQLTLQVTLIERPPRDQAELTPPPAANPAGTRFEHAGLSLHRLDTGLALQLGFPADDSGLLVMQVSECGDSDGLALYDVIEAVGRTEVGMPADFDAAVAGCSGPVLLRVRRQVDGETVTRLIVWER
jgi:serine protease Do